MSRKPKVVNVLDPPAYRPYDAYLQSEWWKSKRFWAIHDAGGRCQVCNDWRKLQVHHRTYERLGKERDKDLTVLCEGCHKIFHEHGKVQQKQFEVWIDECFIEPPRNVLAWDAERRAGSERIKQYVLWDYWGPAERAISEKERTFWDQRAEYLWREYFAEKNG